MKRYIGVMFVLMLVIIGGFWLSAGLLLNRSHKENVIEKIIDEEIIFSNDEYVKNIVGWRSEYWIVKYDMLVYRGNAHDRVIVSKDGDIYRMNYNRINVSPYIKEMLKGFYLDMKNVGYKQDKKVVEKDVPDCSY